ncbi:reverse transcriptase [Gossypium australe]|uniref:Reverse transcriptase n=1 Tax=Gossypium australe TaxID=47621 RepID=A0A5B6VVN6_9ROSI|nr:reverse transcriptase [Gossypium australe]
MSTQMALLDDGSILAELKARPLFLQEICEAQKEDSSLQAKRVLCESNVESDFRVNPDECLTFRDRYMDSDLDQTAADDNASNTSTPAQGTGPANSRPETLGQREEA